jgi:hypothetical protein
MSSRAATQRDHYTTQRHPERSIMASLTINDLPTSRALDYCAMASISGAGGAPWVHGAFAPFVPESDRLLPTINFFQTNNYNNFFIADQLNIQIQNIDVETAADTAVVNVIAGQDSAAVKLGG